MTSMGDKPQALLVVDDEEGMRITLTDILEEFDLTVDVACNGQEAVDMALSRDYALALMDFRMPVMNGVLALKQIKAQRPSLPVIMMTAYADRDAMDEARRQGAEAIFHKPLDMDQVMRFINAVLARNAD